MNDTPLVSVIMPAYNSASFIKDAIQSVQAQTHTNWELFVIDDASTDPTAEVVLKLSKNDRRIHLIRNSENAGTGNARNKGIKAATGSYISFLDADDFWLPEKLEIQLNFMKEHDLIMCFSSYLLMNENGKRTGKMVEALPILTYGKLLRSNYVGNLTGIYNASKIGKIYSPHLRKRQDWALWLSILKTTGETKGILKPLAVYRIRRSGISANKMGLLTYNFRIYKRFLNFGLIKSYSYMSRFLWEHFMVKRKQVKQVK